MEISKTLYITNRKQWRNRLTKNYKTAPDIWLLYPKKHTGRKRIPYGDAVEEALCFGWIDSIIKRVDDTYFAQRFSPRRKNSVWSQPNIERMRKMIKLGLVKQAGMDVFAKVSDIKNTEMKIAPDIMKELKKDSAVWKNFQSFPESYKRIRISFIERRRNNKEEFEKRLAYFIKKTRENKKFAFGGIIN